MLVTKKAINFTSEAINKKGKIIKFNLLENIKNKNAVLFFWPLDFTFVCPSEILALNNRFDEFQKRNTKIIGISIDSIYVHLAWRNTPIKKGGIGKIKFNMISDIKKEIQKLYKVELKEKGFSIRSTFIIDINGIIRHQSTNDLDLGRNIDEIIRLIDAINFNIENKLLCPAQWKPGMKAIIPNKEGICNYLKYNSNKI